MKKILPIGLAVWPYIVFLCYYTANQTYFDIYSVLTLVFYLASAVYVWINRRAIGERELLFWNMTIKLVHIPYYLFCLLVVVGLFIASMIPGVIVIASFASVIIIGSNVLLMLTSSAYGMSALIASNRELSTGYKVLHIIMHCTFVLDVVSAILIYRKAKKVK